MTRELTTKRLPFLLLMAACAVVLAGCNEEKAPPPQMAEPAPPSGEACLQDAIDKLADDKIDEAATAITNAIALLPDSAEALMVEGQVAYRKKDYAKAKKNFDAVASEKSLPAKLRGAALAARAVVEFKQNDFDAAHLTLFRAFRLNRNDPVVCYHLGRLARNTYHFNEVARERFAVAAHFSDPNDPRTKKLRDEIRAIDAEVAQEAASRPGATTRDAGAAAKLIAEAEGLLKKNRVTAATKKYEAALAADPFSYPAARETARLLTKTDKSSTGVDKALLAYRTAIDLRPAMQENYLAAAQLAYANKRWATTVSILERAIAHDPENQKSLDLYIAALKNAGKTKQSAAWSAYRQELR